MKMKKNTALLLMIALSMPANAIAFANTTKNELHTTASEAEVQPINTTINFAKMQVSPFAFPEKPSGRILESDYSSIEGYANAAALATIIAIYAPEPFIKSASGVAAAIFAATGASTTPVYFTSSAEEYYVYDFEGNIIAYRYYLTTTAYKDPWHEDFLEVDFRTVESTSPMSLDVE